jgi:hypothetical protein
VTRRIGEALGGRALPLSNSAELETAAESEPLPKKTLLLWMTHVGACVRRVQAGESIRGAYEASDWRTPFSTMTPVEATTPNLDGPLATERPNLVTGPGCSPCIRVPFRGIQPPVLQLIID